MTASTLCIGAYQTNINIGAYQESEIIAGTGTLDKNLSELTINATAIRAPYVDVTLPDLEVIAFGASFSDVNLPELIAEITVVKFGVDKNLPQLDIIAYSGAYSDNILSDLESTATARMLTTCNGTLPDLSIELDISEIPTLSIDPRIEFQPILPQLKITAKSGERGSLIERLPDLRIEVKNGSHVDLNIPTLELNASGFSAFSGNVNVNLPTLQLTSYSAGKINKKLPSLQIESSGSAGTGLGTWSLDKKLPTISITAVSLTNYITADINLPPLSLDSSGSASVIGTVDVNLSTIKITANMVINVSGEADTTLPELSLTATGYCQSALLDSDLPTLIMSPKGYGDDYDGTESNLSGPSRFDDFTLTYNRWAI